MIKFQGKRGIKMALNWYFEEKGEREGPFDEAAIDAIISEGRILPETLVWNEKMSDWVEAGSTELSSKLLDAELPIIKTVKIPPPEDIQQEGEVPCVNCNQKFSADELVEIDGGLVCAECKPVFIRKLQEGGSVNSIYHHYAGFWIRVLATIIDGLLIAVVQIPLSIIFMVILATGAKSGSEPNIMFTLLIQAINSVISLGIGLTYSAWFVHAKNATPGKMALGLTIINADETETISIPKAIGRHFAKMLSGMILYIGYIMVGLDDEKRGLHDRLCATRVIYKK